MNDQQFHQLRGDQIGDFNVWASLAQKPLFFILNVAVGGNWVRLASLNSNSLTLRTLTGICTCSLDTLTGTRAMAMVP